MDRGEKEREIDRRERDFSIDRSIDFITRHRRTRCSNPRAGVYYRKGRRIEGRSSSIRLRKPDNNEVIRRGSRIRRVYIYIYIGPSRNRSAD